MWFFICSDFNISNFVNQVWITNFKSFIYTLNLQYMICDRMDIKNIGAVEIIKC